MSFIWQNKKWYSKVYHHAGIWMLFGLLTILNFTSYGQSVVTQHNDNKRTGWDAGEATLTQANVSGGTFGKLWQYNVDDQVYAQPLIVNNLTIPGKGTHNVIIIATVNNTVYAFDADDSTKKSQPYWQVNLTYGFNNSAWTDTAGYRAIRNTDMFNATTLKGACGDTIFNYKDFTSGMGIVSTPVIDTNTKTIYFVARSVSNVGGENGNYLQYIHALDITTGAEQSYSPKLINATISGTGDGGTTVTFNSRSQNQRPSLLLSNGTIYIAWASHCDWLVYHGWVMGYSATDLSQQYVYNDTPDGVLGGIWMSGEGPSADDNGNIYLSTGNGTTGTVVGSTIYPDMGRNRSSSVLRLTPSLPPNLTLTDYFTPVDYDYLNYTDQDYGVDGVLLIPNTHLSLSGSKEGYLYMVDINNMGHTVASNFPPDLPQRLDVNAAFNGFDKHVHGSPVYYQDDKGKEYVYAWAEDGPLRQFPLSRAVPANPIFDTLNKITGNTSLPYGMPGAMLSVSSNGNAAGTGILWTTHSIYGDANHNDVVGEIQAFDATDVSHELWNSNLIGNRDTVGTLSKFLSPTIANGKLYVGTFSKNVKVYGLGAPPFNNCPAPPLPNGWVSGDIGFLVNPGNVCYTYPNNGTYTIYSAGADIYGNADAFHSVFQSVSGNSITLTAHIASLDNTKNTGLAKVGIMFRSNLDPGSKNVFLAVQPNVGQGVFTFSNRATQGGQTTGGYIGGPSGSWIRITAVNNVYTVYAGIDTLSFQQLGSPVTINLGTHIYAGLAYTTHDTVTSGYAVVDNVSIQGGSEPLPVTLIDFVGSNIKNQYSLLTWETTAEINFDHFDIEHSTANSSFVSIGIVPGNGNSQINQYYSFSDQHPVDGDNYYRLKMIDKDGKVAYSKVVKVVFSLGVMILYPNPAKDRVYLKNNVFFTSGQNIMIDLTNTLGQHILRRSMKTEGLDQITVYLPLGIELGVYYLKATNSKGSSQNWKILIKN